MALRAAGLSGLPWLAVDSGLCGEALGNEPGIFSARWAGPDRDFGLAMQLVWDNLTAKGPEAGHDAHFVCALALAWPLGMSRHSRVVSMASSSGLRAEPTGLAMIRSLNQKATTS